jgi:hypothetical protein
MLTTKNYNAAYFVGFVLQHVVVSAEAAQAAAQHGRGLVKLPPDMLQTLDGYFKGESLCHQGKRRAAAAAAAAETMTGSRQ